MDIIYVLVVNFVISCILSVYAALSVNWYNSIFGDDKSIIPVPISCLFLYSIIDNTMVEHHLVLKL